MAGADREGCGRGPRPPRLTGPGSGEGARRDTPRRPAFHLPTRAGSPSAPWSSSARGLLRSRCGIPPSEALLNGRSRGEGWKRARQRPGNPRHRLPGGRATARRAGPRAGRQAARLGDRGPPENTAARRCAPARSSWRPQLRSAELEFELVVEREPDNAYAHFGLARTLQRAGRPQHARRHFRLAAALDPRPEYRESRRFRRRGMTPRSPLSVPRVTSCLRSVTSEGVGHDGPCTEGRRGRAGTGGPGASGGRPSPGPPARPAPVPRR